MFQDEEGSNNCVFTRLRCECDRDDLKTPPVSSNKDVQPKHNENEGKSDFSCQVTVAYTYPATTGNMKKKVKNGYMKNVWEIVVSDRLLLREPYCPGVKEQESVLQWLSFV